MSKTSLNIILVALLLGSCSVFKPGLQEGKLYKTKSGLEYTITKKGEGMLPEKGDRIKIKYLGHVGGTIVESSNKSKTPFVFQVGVGQVIKGWDEAFMLLPEGSEANLVIPPSLAYGENAMLNVPSNATLHYNVVLEEIIHPPIPYKILGLDTIKLESGLQYIKVKSTKGAKPNPYRDVTLNYTGYLDNVIFDSSTNRGGAFTFRLGVGIVMAGWDEGIAQMKVGEKIRFIIPPHLAYGEKGLQPTIYSNATLIFDIELLAIE